MCLQEQAWTQEHQNPSGNLCVYVCICMYVYLSMYVYVCISMYVCIYMYVCMYRSSSKRLCKIDQIFMHTHTGIHAYTHRHTCMNTYTNIHTHTSIIPVRGCALVSLRGSAGLIEIFMPVADFLESSGPPQSSSSSLACMYVCVCVCMYACLYVDFLESSEPQSYVYLYIYIHIYIYIYIYIFTHTHIHILTHIQKLTLLHIK